MPIKKQAHPESKTCGRIGVDIETGSRVRLLPSEVFHRDFHIIAQKAFKQLQ